MWRQTTPASSAHTRLNDIEQSLRPIIHYGASNIPGSSLRENQQLVLVNANPFSAYRGPQYVPGVPGVDNRLARYEWIVAKQDSFVETADLPVVESNMNFAYNDYLTSVNGTTLSTLYFSSGFCVQKIEISEDNSGDGSSNDNGGNGETSSAAVVTNTSVGFLALATVVTILLLTSDGSDLLH